MTKLRPLGNRVLVKRSKPATTKGGILLPDSAQEKPREGEILEVGPGKLDASGNMQPVTVKKGEKVLFSPYAGTEVQKAQGDKDEYLILSEDDILGILTK